MFVHEKKPPILHDNFLKDISILTKAEKDKIVTKQIEFAEKEKHISVGDIDEAFRAKAKKSIRFPLCAHLYCVARNIENLERAF